MDYLDYIYWILLWVTLCSRWDMGLYKIKRTEQLYVFAPDSGCGVTRTLSFCFLDIPPWWPILKWWTKISHFSTNLLFPEHFFRFTGKEIKTQVFQSSLTLFFFIKVNFSIENLEGHIMFIFMSKIMIAHKCRSVQISLLVVQNYAENSIPFHPGGGGST